MLMSDIRLSAPTSPAALNLTAPVDFQAAADEGKRPTFSIVGYTGAPVIIGGWYTPVIVDLTGLKAASQTIPALRGHDLNRIVGQTDSVKIDASGVHLTGVVTGDNADANEVVSQSKNGFKWQASIGASVIRREFLEAGKRATVNGRAVSGPLVIAREAILNEISFTALGADNKTSASVAASNTPGNPQGSPDMNFEAWLQAKGFDPAALTDDQKAALKAAYDAEQAPPAQAQAQAQAPETPAPAQTLDDILADHRREEARVAEITRITADVLRTRPFMADELERMAKAAIAAQKTTPEEYELLLYRATLAQPSRFAIHSPERKASVKVIEAAVCLSAGLSDPEKHFDERTLEAANDRFRHGLGLVELLMLAARENGHGSISARDVRGLLRASFSIQAGGFSTLDVPGIVSNTANKFLVDAFNHVESGWRSIAATRPVTDFKTVTSYSLTGELEYEEVGPAGEIKHGTLGEETYSNRAKSYGKILAITYQDIRNDDLGAFARVPRMLGRGGALKINDVFWSEFMNNSAFFTALRGNYFEGATTALSIDSLTKAEGMFFDQTDPNGKPLGVTPRILLVPNGLNAKASQLMNSTEVRDTTANTNYGVANPHAGKFSIVRSSYLSNASYTGYSATAWYLLADPQDVPVIEAAFLDGRDMPLIESADADFDRLGIQIRGVHHFGVAKQEYRGGVMSKGAA